MAGIDKSAKRLLLDEWKDYEEYATQLRNAYYALKYGQSETAITYLKSAELSGLPEKLVDRLVEAIRKEQGND